MRQADAFAVATLHTPIRKNAVITNKHVLNAIVLALVASVSVHAAPKIQFEKESLDFGSVRSGDPINVTFTLTNAGDADLQINGVKPGCGCTKAEAKKTTLAPNESTTIEAVFNSAGFSGRINKSIAVTTNDPLREALVLMIQGQVIPLATVTPSLVSFGTLQVNKTANFTLNLAPTDPKSFAVVKVEPVGSHVTVTGFRKIDSKTGVTWQVSLVVKGGTVAGRVMETVIIKTNAAKNANLNVLVYGNVTE
jgi:hypothetical protein